MRYFILCTFLFFSSCEPGAVFEKNACDLCREDQTCVENEECIDNSRICADTICEENELCHNDLCYENTLRFLKIATFNMYDFSNYDSIENTADFIIENNIGIINLQEVQIDDITDLMDTLEQKNFQMYYGISSYGGYGGDTGNDYLAVLSQWPITSADTILGGVYEDPVTGLDYSFSNMRPILMTKVNIYNQDVVFFNMHLKAEVPYPDCVDCINKRRAQAHALENYILDNLDPLNDRIVVTGDANTAIDEDFENGNTIDILCMKTDNPENTSNDFLPVNLTYAPESTHVDFDSILDHLIISPSLVDNYIFESIDIKIPRGIPSDHKSVLLEFWF
ncbi:MAG: endonuclease/exonuclease/phosphatase family protein [Deltaproteobacteria bacterium]|nr:endonuclease/exonuclease/phosphatase family protein [Deltaproteobacteria bacterium]